MAVREVTEKVYFCDWCETSKAVYKIQNAYVCSDQVCLNSCVEQLGELL